MNHGAWIWRNGELVPWEEATEHVSAHVFHYGSSVFEGLRAYATPRGPAVFRLRPHTQRMVNSCKIARIALPYSAEQLDEAILELLRANGHEACYIRPLTYRGTGQIGVEGRGAKVETVIFSFDWGAYLGTEAIEQGVDVQISTWRRFSPGTLPGMAKIGGQYINSQFITMEAADNGFAEGIALGHSGNISEGAGENIFVVLDGEVYTTGAGASILMGVTRASALTILDDLGYRVRYEDIPREMLYIADEVFFTGTAAEITPVRSVDRIPIGSGSRGPVTEQVQQRFFGITNGTLEDPYGWLTYIQP
ncbi:MAG: branched-chain amino acid transaminase [Anaerolineaceae bacterium]|nr:branched-chain amino acid transaminase [Chloroflexota bacterium]MCY4008191.1 branched-chain amino acid transaminase [Anaerolineaceae bacterium]